MVPRARVSVWPGRRRVPGIVAPDSWGARGSECLPRDVLRRSSPATSPCDGTTARRCLCHGTGPAPRKHAPPQAVYPRRLMGVWGIIAPPRQFRAGFSEQFIILARKYELTPDFLTQEPDHTITYSGSPRIVIKLEQPIMDPPSIDPEYRAARRFGACRCEAVRGWATPS